MTWLLMILLLISGDITKLKKADGLYRQEKYEDAYKIYREELDKNPGDFELAFNAGNALYKMGKFDEAEKLFDHAKTLTKSATQSSAGQYNQSLANFKKKELEKSLSGLKDAIRQNPEDADAKANFEVISRLLKKQQQQQQQQQKDQNKQDKEQKKDDKQKQQDQKDQDKKDQKDQQKEQPQQSQIPKEQAQRLLDALKKNEKEALLKRKEMSGKVRKQVEKDW
ncbi:MAG: tetratricopeptide repeat protein [Bacteroidetes bacterium]|nr:tetratricopeptide repeat protein [Bacteroidota bacterium]